MHSTAYQEVESFVSRLPLGKELRIGDVGAYNVNGCLRPLFQKPGWKYVGMDLSAGPNVDVVLAGEKVWTNVEDESFDVVVSVSTLEHTRYPWLVVGEIARILKKGGITCLVAPYSWEHHAYPIDCYRFLPDGMKAMMELAGLEITSLHMRTYDGATKGDTIGIGRKP